MLEGVDDAEADEGEHHGDGRHDRHDHPQLARGKIEKEMLDVGYNGNIKLCITAEVSW